MVGLYRLNASFGREGDLEGLFLADSEDVKYLIDNQVSVYFGEVLGKHSEVYGSFSSDEIELITEDEKVIDIFRKYNISSGYNPFVYNVCILDLMIYLKPSFIFTYVQNQTTPSKTEGPKLTLKRGTNNGINT